MKEVIFLNGNFIEGREAAALVSSPGFLCGVGLFETMRSYKGNIVYFNAHIERIKNSCVLVGMKLPYAPEKLKDFIRGAIERSGFNDVYVRLTLWKSQKMPDTSVIVKKYNPPSCAQYQKGFSVSISAFRLAGSPFFAQLKTTSRVLYELGFREAKERGFDEAILLNNNGYVCEGTRSNIFLVKGRDIFTPSLECGCLNGITRRVALDLAKKNKIKFYECRINLQDLYRADEVFLTNSLIGIMPLRRLGKNRVGRGPNKLTSFFANNYKRLLYGT